MTDPRNPFAGKRVMVVAFEGWNDAGDAATRAATITRDGLSMVPTGEIEGEEYYDYQVSRPEIQTAAHGAREIAWPETTLWAPIEVTLQLTRLVDDPALEGRERVYVLQGPEPARRWRSFVDEVFEHVDANDIDAVIVMGALLADVPHSRPLPVHLASESVEVRRYFDIERSDYEGPIGLPSVIEQRASAEGMPTMSLWVSVPHYVHHAQSPKATLALLDRLEEVLDITIPRAELIAEAAEWERQIDSATQSDDDMESYIHQLEEVKDTVDSPEASGDAIAREFERFLLRSDHDADATGEPGTERSSGDEDASA